MKTITCSIAALLFSAFVMNAQDVDVKKETTTKKEVVQDTKVETKVNNEVRQQKKVIQVEDSDVVNANASLVTPKSNKTEVKEKAQTPQQMQKADVQAEMKNQEKADTPGQKKKAKNKIDN